MVDPVGGPIAKDRLDPQSRYQEGRRDRTEQERPQERRRVAQAAGLADQLGQLATSGRGGISRISSSALAARMFVSFLGFEAFTSRSSERAFSPTIIPS